MPRETSAREGTLTLNGRDLRYVAAGAGEPLIVFPSSEGETFGSLEEKLAESNRVISLELSSIRAADSRPSAEELSQAIKRLGFERYSVMGVSEGAADALAQALAAPDASDKLVLLAPGQLFGPAIEPGQLNRVTAATLILIGTNDTSGAAEVGRLCREKIRACHLSFVYGAGQALASERSEACFDTIKEFLEQGEQFIICRESQMLRP